MSRTGRNLSAFTIAALSLLALPALAGAADPSVVKVKPYGLTDGRAKILSRVTVAGSLSPWREGQRVRVFFYRNAKPLFSKSVVVQKGDGNWGTFRARVTMRRGGKHAVQVRYYGRGGDQPLAPDSTVRVSLPLPRLTYANWPPATVIWSLPARPTT